MGLISLSQSLPIISGGDSERYFSKLENPDFQVKRSPTSYYQERNQCATNSPHLVRQSKKIRKKSGYVFWIFFPLLPHKKIRIFVWIFFWIFFLDKNTQKIKKKIKNVQIFFGFFQMDIANILVCYKKHWKISINYQETLSSQVQHCFSYIIRYCLYRINF